MEENKKRSYEEKKEENPKRRRINGSLDIDDVLNKDDEKFCEKMNILSELKKYNDVIGDNIEKKNLFIKKINAISRAIEIYDSVDGYTIYDINTNEDFVAFVSSDGYIFFTNTKSNRYFSCYVLKEEVEKNFSIEDFFLVKLNYTTDILTKTLYYLNIINTGAGAPDLRILPLNAFLQIITLMDKISLVSRKNKYKEILEEYCGLEFTLSDINDIDENIIKDTLFLKKYCEKFINDRTPSFHTGIYVVKRAEIKYNLNNLLSLNKTVIEEMFRAMVNNFKKLDIP